MTTQRVYSPSASVTMVAGVGGVREGRLVAAATDNTVVEAGAGSQAVVGVAAWTALAGERVTVDRFQELEVEYAATANAGTRLISAAGGALTPVPAPTSAGASPTAAEFTSAVNNSRAICAICTETVAAPGKGKAYVGLI